MTQGIHRYHIYDFLTNCSKVIDQNSYFPYLMTRRWRCSQLWHGPSNNAYNQVYQFLFRLIKLWPRYSLYTNFGSTSLSLRHHNFWTKMNKKICSVISMRLSPKIIWAKFGQNWTNFEGGVAKKRNTVLYKMATTVMGGVLMYDIGSDQHDEMNQVYLVSFF